MGRLSQASVCVSGGQVPFDQPAEHDAVALGEPRLERPEDAHARAALRRPAHHAPGQRGGEKLDIVGRRNGEVAGGSARRQFIECVRKPRAVGTGEDAFLLAVARQRGQHIAMARGHVAQRPCFPADTFERRQRGGEPAHEFAGGRKLAIGEIDARIGGVQIDLLLAAEFLQLGSQGLDRAGKAGAAAARARATQDRALKRGDGTLGAAQGKPQAADA